MEVTRQLRLNQPDRAGRVHIQLTICWEGKRQRLATRLQVKPAYWGRRVVASAGVPWHQPH